MTFELCEKRPDRSRQLVRTGIVGALLAAITVPAVSCGSDNAMPTAPSTAATTSAPASSGSAASAAGTGAPTNDVSAGTATATTATATTATGAADTIPPSAPTNYCFTGPILQTVFRWSPSVDNVDRPDQITYFLWDVVSAKTGFGRVVGATRFGPVYAGANPSIIVINAVDRAGNASGFVVAVPCADD